MRFLNRLGRTFFAKILSRILAEPRSLTQKFPRRGGFFAGALRRMRELRQQKKQFWRSGIYSENRGWMESQGGSGLSIARMCELTGVSRASFYRHRELKAATKAGCAGAAGKLSRARWRGAWDAIYWPLVHWPLWREPFIAGIRNPVWCTTQYASNDYVKRLEK